MKRLYFIIFFLLTVPCFSQTQIIDSIPNSGVILNTGWKFNLGDNIDWANPNFNDSYWRSIDPTLEISDMPQLKPGRVYWLRLRVILDTDLLKKSLVLTVQQSGASEIFINGKLVYKFGSVNTDPQKVLAYDPSANIFSYSVNNSREQVFAIRYALQPKIMYSRLLGFRNLGLEIRIKEIQSAVDENNQAILRFLGQNNFRLGLWFLLAVVHLAFYVFYPPQKANLYFGVYALLNTLGHWGYLLSYNNHSVENKFYYGNITEGTWVFSSLFIVTAMYALLHRKRGYIFWTIVAIGILKIPLNIFSYTHSAAWRIGSTVYGYAVNLEITRISLLAIKTKKKGAWIIAGGGICFITFWLAYSNSALLGITNHFFIDIFFNFSTLSYPVVISIYLGLDFAFISRSLNQKLKEVETLSGQTIAQQKEKQQILASQNEILENQVVERTKKLSASLNELKSTQAQLIQSEKMASLGELTAGIAHEIQNPLNFVNNFSEVSNELIDEMKQELQNNNKEDAIAIADDIKQNLEKINHHGKRADAIVKSMLQHSQKSTGQKQPTNINALCGEYLRMSYHGLKAKDKEFSAEIKTDFDPAIPNVDVVSQDIGRVLLNLFNNAFYAVRERQKAEGEGYEATVAVTTKKISSNSLSANSSLLEAEGLLITITDNGNGIPQSIIDKIFQPFFTTKPTGSGTGLGLSMSYDIIKAHGGEIRVESEAGEGSVFTIEIPSA